MTETLEPQIVRPLEKNIKVNAQVLAFHGPLIYKAKVLKTHEPNKTFVINSEGQHEPLHDLETTVPPHLMDTNSYFLHYMGWNLKWDEWVTDERIMDLSEENMNIRRNLRQKFDEAKKPSPPVNNTPVKKIVKIKNPVKVKREKEKRDLKPKKKKDDIILPMPDKIKHLLVDDWESVTKDRKLVSIPAKKPVKVILEDYLKFAGKIKTQEQMDITKEMISGLTMYFNQSVRLILLYKYERLQYGNLLKEHGDIDLGDYYGIEHLLRLFVSLPGLVSQTMMDAPSIQTLMRESSEILEYLDSHTYDYINEYENTTPAYDGLARS